VILRECRAHSFAFYSPADLHSEVVVAERTCTVSFTDVHGVTHSVEVMADSLFEAAVRGVKILRSGDWNDPPHEATTLEIQVRNPSIKHIVTLQHVARWLNGGSSSPAESMKKANLRKLLMAR
jgi:hypothetical protein